MRMRFLLVLVLLIGQIPPSFAAVKLGGLCTKVGLTAKSQKVDLICKKSGKLNRWVEKSAAKPTSTVSAEYTQPEQLLISPVPKGNFNTTFMLGKPQSRDIGESLFFESEAKLSSLEFEVSLLTWISPEFHTATEEEKRAIERSYFRGQYKPLPASVNVSLWRDDFGVLAEIPEKFDLKNGFTKVDEFEVNINIEVGNSVRIKFPKQVNVKPGHYFLNMYFTVNDLYITTLRFAGRQTGINTLGGPKRDMPTNCAYTPAKDLYPQGQAYFSYQDTFWDQKSPEEKWNYQTPRSYTFKLHDYAKVTECGVVGSYNDILNTGDIFLDIYGSKP
jgi:hypothetical protein